MPSNYGNVSATFNVADLSLFDVGDSRTNPFEEGGNDGEQDAGPKVQDIINRHSQDPLQGIGGPMTRARTRQMKEALQGLIMEVLERESVLKGFNALPRLITYLKVEDDGPGLIYEEQGLESKMQG